MFNILKGLEIFYRYYIPRYSLLFFGNLACFGVTVRFSTSKSYWVDLEMESEVSNLSESSSTPISVILV